MWPGASLVDTGGPANILRKLRYGSFPAFSKNRVRSTITPLVSKNSQRVVALSRRKRNVELCHPVSINFDKPRMKARRSASYGIELTLQVRFTTLGRVVNYFLSARETSQR